MVLAPDLPGLPESLRRAAGVVLDAVLPPQCLSCRWAEIDFIADPRCAACGRPFEFDVGPDALCGACIAEQPAYGRARSVMCYGERSRGLVIGFKHGDRTERAKTFGDWMARVGGEILSGADTLVPVPLHRGFCRGAFAVRPGQEPEVRGRRLVLVDDVMTTGATVSACAQILLKAGAATVDVLTLVQVVRPEERLP